MSCQVMVQLSDPCTTLVFSTESNNYNLSPAKVEPLFGGAAASLHIAPDPPPPPPDKEDSESDPQLESTEVGKTI